MNRRAAIGALVVVALVAIDLAWDAILPDGSARQLALLVACNVVVAVSLNVTNGMAGQFSIGHAGFMAIGAYAGAVVASHLHLAMGGGDPTFARSIVVVLIAFAIAGLVAGACGVVVGIPSLRLRGDYLAIVTLAFAEIVRLVIASAPSGGASLVSKLGGANGYAGPDEQGVPLVAGPLWIFGVAIAVVIVAWRIKHSAWGRALRAVREDEIAAASVGVDPTRFKVTSFVLTAAGGGLAGAMIALMRDGAPIVQPDSFGFATSFDAAAMVVLGGSGSVTGAALGAVIVTVSVRAIELVQHAIESWGRVAIDLNALRMMAYAAILIVVMVRRPAGIFGDREARWISR